MAEGGGWRDGSAIKSIGCSSRGPTWQFTPFSNFSSRGSDAPHKTYTGKTPVHINTDKTKKPKKHTQDKWDGSVGKMPSEQGWHPSLSDPHKGCPFKALWHACVRIHTQRIKRCGGGEMSEQLGSLLGLSPHVGQLTPAALLWLPLVLGNTGACSQILKHKNIKKPNTCNLSWA